jgi:hypothetical protein
LLMLCTLLPCFVYFCFWPSVLWLSCMQFLNFCVPFKWFRYVVIGKLQLFGFTLPYLGVVYSCM